MSEKHLTFEFAQKFEDFSCIGGGHMTAVFCASTPSILFDPGVSVFGPLCLKRLPRLLHTKT